MEHPGFVDRLLFLCRLLEKEKINYMLVGGVAVGVWAAPRATVDIDLLIAIAEDDLEWFKNKIHSKEVVVFNKPLMRFRRIKIFRFFLRGRSSEELLMVDAILADDEFKKKALARCEKIPLKGTQVRVAALEDLILFKLLGGRNQDIIDVDNIVEVHGKVLDRE